MKEELQNAREDYQAGSLSLDSVANDPVDQFLQWFEEFKSSGTKDFNAMTLSTVDAEGKPSSRVVLLKGVENGAFEFYTNYQSEKGQEILNNPNVALNFFWAGPERQVRVEGIAEKMSEEESEKYFHSRPVSSQIGAWTSPQSEKISSRQELEERQKHYEDKFGEKVPKPPHWGGFKVKPIRVEFWQGRSSRLHDRINYRLENGAWVKERLAP